MSLKHPIKAAIVQMEVKPGRPDLNAGKILLEIDEARQRGDDMIVFPEMAVPGYLIGDEWENLAFVKDACDFNNEIKKASRDILVIWGNVHIDASKVNEDGRVRKYNGAFVAQNSEWVGQGITYKTLLPNYREFDDARHFYSLRKKAGDLLTPIENLLNPFEANLSGQTVKIGAILCEDMWSDDYHVDPITILLSKGADMIVNISASPWTWRKNDKRHRVVRDRLRQKPAAFIYANAAGIQNNGKNIYLFDGASTVYLPDGSIQTIAREFAGETIRAVICDTNSGPVAPPPVGAERDIEELYNGLIYGIRKFFEGLNSPPVLVGISGGIDSSLSAALLTIALGNDKVYTVNMPSKYNSQTTRTAARKLAENLAIHYTVTPIQESYEYTVNQLNRVVFEKLDRSGKETEVKLSDLNSENVQARDRGSRVLAGIASALGAVYVNNGNKTEIAIGYATLYGDVNGALSILGDIYKTQVYELAHYINSLHGELIPRESIEVTASAELSAAQNVDEGKGDPINYPYHDRLMKAFIEFRLDPEDILLEYAEGRLAEKLGLDNATLQSYFPDHESFIQDLEHKWRAFKMNVFKRIQAPPIITVSKRAFGFDLREAQNGVYFTRRYYRLKEKILRE